MAVILGVENFWARELAGSLVEKGMRVETVGESIEGLEEIEGQIRYFFDFDDGEEMWQEVIGKGAKLCVVSMSGEGEAERLERKLAELSGDWRLVVGVNVYGVGMGEEGFLGEALSSAARNKNLKLPKLGVKFRLLSSRDGVEAIMRASILSGTAGRTFWVAGDEVDSKGLAEVLVDEAKMTRLSVIQEEMEVGEIDEAKIEETRKILRWKPEVELRVGIAEVVKDLVMRVDEEGRRRTRQKQGHLGGSAAANALADKQVKREKYQEVVIEEIDEKYENTRDDLKDEEIMEGDMEVSFAQEGYGRLEEEYKIEPLMKKDSLVLNPPVTAVAVTPSLDKEGNTKTGRKRRFEWVKKIKWIWVGAIMAGVVGGILSWPIVGVLGATFKLGEPLKLIEENRTREALKKISMYKERNRKAGEFLENSGLGRWPILSRIEELSGVTGEVFQLEERLISVATVAEKINQAVFEEGEINWTGELQKMTDNLKEVEMEAGMTAARLSEIKRWMPGRWKPEVEKMTSAIREKLEIVGKVRELVTIAPELMGLDGKRREYMVLLQNEMEIRASGGFIGSFAILSFEGGRLLAFEVKDVYEADGQLKGHVEPPEEIKKYLGEAGWFMRDANWQASFPQASKEIQWFLEKETGRKVDGVIGVDLAVAKMILRVIGEIYVPDFKEKINKENLYEQAEFWSETKSFPGSVQKASFLGGLGKQLFEEIRGLKTTKRWELMAGIIEMLDRNEIQLAINQSAVSGVVADLGWDGAVYEGKCGGSDSAKWSEDHLRATTDKQVRCYADYLYVVESNFGVNKANYFLYRNIEEKVDLTEGSIKRDLKINYENTAKSNNWPGGDYKNYLRVYVPRGVEVTEVGIGEGGVMRSIPLSTVKMREIYGKKEIGFLVTVPIGKKITVGIKYQSGGVGQGDKFSYLQYVQRQPGFGDTAMVTLVSIPEGWQPVQVTPAASMSGGKMLFNQKLDKDIKMGVEIGK